MLAKVDNLVGLPYAFIAYAIETVRSELVQDAHGQHSLSMWKDNSREARHLGINRSRDRV